MNATTYKTQPGTIPHRVIEHFKTLPPGTELTIAEIADAIGIHYEGFTTCIKPAKMAGLMKCRYSEFDNRRAYWSLGDGVPLPKPPAPDEQPKLQEATQAPAATAEPVVATTPEPEAPPPAPARTTKPRHFLIGEFSDGTVHMEVGTHIFKLDERESTIARQFLARGTK